MSDAFMKRMLERNQARKSKLEKISSLTDGKENAPHNFLGNSSNAESKPHVTKSILKVNEFENIENDLSKDTKNSPNKNDLRSTPIESPKKSNLKSVRKSPTKPNTDYTSSHPKDLISNQVQFSSNESKPRLGALARLTKQRQEWDDDYNYRTSNSGTGAEEAQGFTPSESKSRLIYDFEDESHQKRKASPMKNLSKSPRNEFNVNLPTVKSSSSISYTPPPPKVLSCVLKSQDNSPSKPTSPVKNLSRDLSPSKVNNLRDKWEEQIRQASPDRQAQRSPSRSPNKYNQTDSRDDRSRPKWRSHSELQSNVKASERSRSPIKSHKTTSNLDSPSKIYSHLSSNYSTQDTLKSNSNLTQVKGPISKSNVVKGSNVMPDTVPIVSNSLSVKDRAAAFDFAKGKKEYKDPAELSVNDRLNIFEKQTGAAPLIPKAPFGQSVPAKALQANDKVPNSNKPVRGLAHSQKVNKPAKQNLASSMPGRVWPPPKEDSAADKDLNGVEAHKRLFEHQKDEWHMNDINTKIQNERQKEIDALNNRFRRPKPVPTAPKYEDTESEYAASDESYAESTSSFEDNTYMHRNEQLGPPKPPRIYAQPDTISLHSDKSPNSPPKIRLNSTELGESPRKEYTPRVKPGCLFPSLSDIESHSELADSQSEDDLPNSSFAESILTCASMNSLGCQIQQIARKSNNVELNPIEEQSAVPTSMMNMTTTTLDDMDAIEDAIDEALFDGVTPPKKSKQEECEEFKTPKVIRSSDSSSESDISLAHSVSMYRKQKPAEVSVTPVRRIVQMCETSSPEPSSPVSPSVNISTRIRELQQQESKQLSVISQASSALSVVANRPEQQGTLQHIEAEKLLLVASQKRLSAQNEIQRLEAEGALGTKSWGSDDDSCRGSLSISAISLPLKDQFISKGMSGNKIYHLMVLVKHRDQVISSELLSTPNCIVENSVTFPNLISLHDLTSDFNVTLEIYMLYIENNSNLHPFKKEHSRLKLTPLKRLHKMDSKMNSPIVQSPGGPYAVRTSSFTLVGFTHLNISTLTRNVWALEKVPFNSPFDGHLIMKVRCSMEGGETESSFLTMFEDIGGFGSWNRRWCVLSGTTIKYWRYPDDQNKKECQGCIDLRCCTTRKVELVSRDVCARMHTFELVLVRPATPADRDNLVQEVKGSNVIMKFLLSADSREERLVWCDKLNRSLVNIRAWDPDALRPNDFQV